MKTVLKIAGALLLVLVLIGAGGFVWASTTSSRVLNRTFTAHSVDIPVPFPPSREELAALAEPSDEERAEIDSAMARRLAMERAVERGRHLVEARYGCTECHGADFSGGVMVDDPLLGRLLGPNLTEGEGGVTAGYTTADWDRIVRHGLRPDGTPAVMPSEDFQNMSDQELSDIIAYVRAQPPVDNEVPPVRLGPLGKILVATGALPLSADHIDSHDAPHPVYPPPAEVSVEFGRHLAGTCTGCHGQDMAGGPIAGGDPSWPPARNLTPHEEDGLGTWSYDDFVAAMREGVRPDGTELLEPMTMMAPYARRMTEVELQALWRYLQSLPPVAGPE